MCWFGRRCVGLVGDVVMGKGVCWFGRRCVGLVGMCWFGRGYVVVW